MRVGCLEALEGGFVLLFGAVEECLEDEEVCVVGVHLETFLDLEFALVDVALYQIILGLLIQLLYLR